MSRWLTGLEPGLGGQRIDGLRSREQEADVSTLELFFDLVYVFAVSQASHLLFEELTWRGAIEAGLITIAIWWAWIDTAWITNWFDPRKMPVRLMLITLMALSLVMSSAIPEAFSDRAVWFALAYVAIQVGRSAFCLFMLGRNEQTENFVRLTFWSVVSAPLWIAGAIKGGDAQLVLWGVAALLDSAAPALGFTVPGIGRSSTDLWTISGGHLAERCQLFVIIALGESVLLTGSSLARSEHVAVTTWLAVAAAFTLSVMMWWVYFARAGRATEIFAQSKNPGAMGRVYTYFHLPMIAGIIVLAVANEMVIAHPNGEVEDALIAVAVIGALLYLFGNAVFNSTITGSFPWRRLAAALAVTAVVPFAAMISPLALLVWIAIPFVVLAAVDSLTLPTRDQLIELDE